MNNEGIGGSIYSPFLPSQDYLSALDIIDIQKVYVDGWIYFIVLRGNTSWGGSDIQRSLWKIFLIDVERFRSTIRFITYTYWLHWE